MLNWLKHFWTTGDDSTKIIFLIIGIFFKEVLWNNLVRLLKLLWKLAFSTGGKLKKTIQLRIKQSKKDRQYRKTIQLIEKKKISIPNHFLLMKSKEKNPELAKIFQMIENEELEAPESYKIAKIFRDNPDAFKIDFEKLKSNIKRPNK